MADWDPFADPADLPQAQKPPAKVAPKEVAVEDPLARLQYRQTEAKKTPLPELQRLVDEFFTLPISTSDEVVREVFESLLAAGSSCPELSWMLWQKAIPMLLDPGKRKEAAASPSFGMLVDHQSGFLVDLTSNPPSDVIVQKPSGASSGIVVFLFVWGGGTVADLDDIAALYTTICPGALIVRLGSNMKDSFGLGCECAEAIRATAAFWQETNGKAPQLLVHLFSNAGFMTWTEMLRLWDTISTTGSASLPQRLPPMSEVLRGVILDSACDSNIQTEACIQSLVQSTAAFVRAVAAHATDGSEESVKTAEMESRKVVGVIIAPDSPLKAHLLRKPRSAVTAISNADAHVVLKLEPPVRQQFIFSKDDAIILCSAVERYYKEVSEKLTKAGCPTPGRLCFDKSKHCFHKIEHSEEYFRCVRSFVEDVLQR